MAKSVAGTPRPELLLRGLLARPLRSAVIVAALCLVLGIAVAVEAGSTLRFPDEREYLSLATNVADHGSYSYDGLHPTAYRPPGYPLFLAGLRAVGLGVVGMRVAGAQLLALSILLLFVFLRRIYGPLTTLATCGVTAVYPLLLYSSTRLYPQALSLTLLLATLIAGQQALSASSARARLLWGALAGLLGGAQFLVVPPVGLLTLAIAVGVIAIRRKGLHALLVALAVGALLPAAWAFRNYEAMDAFVPVSTNSGLNLLIGNSEHATPSTGLDADVSRYTQYAKSHHLCLPPYCRTLVNPSEVGANAYFQREALKWALHHPFRELALYAGKAAYNFAPINRLHTAGESSPGTALVSAVTYLPFLALFVLQLLFWALGRRRMTPGEALLVAIIIGNALVQAVSMTRVRYRVPTDPLIIAVGVNLLLGLLPTRRRPGDLPMTRRLPARRTSAVARETAETPN
jgi:hypothetical protein